MKLKIIYTGKEDETRIINKETGEHIEGIVAVNISMEPFITIATLTLANDGLEFELDNVEGKVENEDTGGLHGEGRTGYNSEDREQVSDNV
jgi:hypothetical protein